MVTADDLKKCLNECISEIVFHHNEFSLVPKAFPEHGNGH